MILRPLFLTCLLPLISCSEKALAPSPPIMFVILSQPEKFHESVALKTKESLEKQWEKFVPDHVMNKPNIILTHQLEDEAISKSAWTIFPLISPIMKELSSSPSVEWVAILNENTELNLRNLYAFSQTKAEYKPREHKLFIGRGLKDAESTIIHHFDSFERSGVMFPDLDAGFFLSRALLEDISERILASKVPSDFNIDAPYEFAKFVYQEGKGVSLTNLDEFCGNTKPKNPEKCITHPRSEYVCLKKKQTQSYEEILSKSFFAVKTCKEFHESRVSVVKNTWGKYPKNIQYFSEVADDSIPTVHLDYTINTESGHCNKTLAILQHFLTLPTSMQWLIIADDDTIMSVARLTAMLACYPPGQAILLGQRYGYMVSSGGGYGYITGGGGIIFSREAVEKLLGSPGGCGCPEPDTPDDMHLGICAARAGLVLTHSNRFHQARPDDYPRSVLSYRKPVSFHKHWEVDPYEVYDEWFKKHDEGLNIGKDEL